MDKTEYSKVYHKQGKTESGILSMAISIEKTETFDLSDYVYLYTHEYEKPVDVYCHKDDYDRMRHLPKTVDNSLIRI